MLVEPTFWLYTSGKVTLNEMVEDFHINRMSKCWKFGKFSSPGVESCLFFFFFGEYQSMSSSDSFEI